MWCCNAVVGDVAGNKGFRDDGVRFRDSSKCGMCKLLLLPDSDEGGDVTAVDFILCIDVVVVSVVVVAVDDVKILLHPSDAAPTSQSLPHPLGISVLLILLLASDSTGVGRFK